MSRRIVSPHDTYSDMRIGCRAAEHQVLDRAAEIESSGGYDDIAQVLEAACRRIGEASLSSRAGRRQLAVEAAALLLFAVTQMDASAG